MGYKSKFKGAEIDARLEKMVKVTYAELKALRDEGKLIAGQMYRMTDYETTCTWENTQVAGHPFDLVLTALDNKTLDEKCSAIWSERDTDGYFADCNLPAWDVRYCLDNDADRFVWMNEDLEMVTWVDSNGKGVIYRLIDESRNDVPYDFKNIMFSRPLTEGKYDAENGIDTFCYTFCCINDETFEIADQSVVEPHNCTSNKFNLYCYNNVFLTFKGYECYSNTFGDYCLSNTFGDNCDCNTFGDNCDDNTFGDSCCRNTFGSYCNNNTFGDYCYSNTFGNECYSNTFGNECSTNTFRSMCISNTFGDECYSNTFGNECSTNTFVYYCSSNTFGEMCHSNVFGEYCHYNAFGDYCFSNDFGDCCNYNAFGDYCHSNTLVNHETASYENVVQYYHISCISVAEIQVYRGREYDTYITKDKSGNIVEYTIDDIINK